MLTVGSVVRNRKTGMAGRVFAVITFPGGRQECCVEYRLGGSAWVDAGELSPY